VSSTGAAASNGSRSGVFNKTSWAKIEMTRRCRRRRRHRASRCILGKTSENTGPGAVLAGRNSGVQPISQVCPPTPRFAAEKKSRYPLRGIWGPLRKPAIPGSAPRDNILHFTEKASRGLSGGAKLLVAKQNSGVYEPYGWDTDEVSH
jgi:hypothetical protein